MIGLLKVSGAATFCNTHNVLVYIRYGNQMLFLVILEIGWVL